MLKKILNVKKSVEELDNERDYDPFVSCHYCDPLFDLEDIKMLLVSLRKVYVTFDEESKQKEIYLNFAIPDYFLYASQDAEYVVIPDNLAEFLDFGTDDELKERAMKLRESYEFHQRDDREF